MSTPTEIVHLLSQVIHAVDAANLHVVDGLNKGQKHHFESALREVERAKRGLESALEHTDRYLEEIKEEATPRGGGVARGGLKCKVCGNAAKWKDADGSNYYCSVECSKK